MRNFTIVDNVLLAPFNEPARNLTVIGAGRQPMFLKIHQKEVTARVLGPTPVEEDLNDILDLRSALSRRRDGVSPNDEVFVYRDNIFFDEEFLQFFLTAARNLGQPCQAVLPGDDLAWLRYTIPLSSLKRVDPQNGPAYYPVQIWYFPKGWADPNQWVPLAVPSGYIEKGYYNIPDSMTNIKVDALEEGEIHKEQDLTHYLTERTCSVIESWVHLFNCTVPMGVFSHGSRFEESITRHNFMALKLLFQAVLEQKQILSSSSVVEIGAGTQVHPSAILLGPTKIGRNCDIGPGAIIDNCVIGDNVTIAQGCQLMLSVVGNNCFLPFRGALFMTTLMENTIVAQNTCLQMCVIGRNSFIGAGTTFTDFNLLPSPIRALNYRGEYDDIRQPVIGGCIGHNCRIGAGMIIYPARTVESDTILTASPDRRVIMKGISYEQSDHHPLPTRISALHKRLYQRGDIQDESQLLDEWT
jgi:carbonic anhydrase/acetyltransferase-like protein (isoleucine patch superfamily)